MTESFDEAVSKWTWINTETENHVFLVTSSPACSKDGTRVVYEVTKLEENKSKKTVTLTAAQTTWDKVIHDGEITAEAFGHNNGRRRALQVRGEELEAFGVHKSFVGSLYSKTDDKDNKKSRSTSNASTAVSTSSSTSRRTYRSGFSRLIQPPSPSRPTPTRAPGLA